MPRPLFCLIAVVSLCAAGGCGSDPPTTSTPTAPQGQNGSTAFDPTACGTITGAVTWIGPLPEIIRLSHSVPHADGKSYETRPVTLANAPHIEWATRGVGDAVVFLRGVDPTRARPWDLPSVSVEFRDSQIMVRQGKQLGRAGFVRKGAEVEMRSAEKEFQVLRGRGAAFFAVAFPDPDKPVKRTFDTCGRVELSSAAGLYWQAADLFVCDHPYYALTTPDGGFCFDRVPAGTYDLVVWHPSWIVTRADRNPESGVLNRLYYSPPLELSRSVTVSPGRTTLANLTLPANLTPQK